MANPKPCADYRAVTVPARGEPLKAILMRAEQRGLPYGQAALTLIDDALATAPASAIVDLATISTDDLIEELLGRLKAVSDAELWRARAEAAEVKLAMIAGTLTSGGTA